MKSSGKVQMPHRSGLRLKPSLLVLACSLLLVPVSLAAEKPSPAREHLEAATFQFRAKRFKRAAKLGRKALEVATTPAERQDALNLIAIALRGQADGDPELLAEAEAALRESLTLDEDKNLTTAYNLVIVLKEAGKAREALELAREIYGAAEGARLADEARIQACQAKEKLAGEAPDAVARDEEPHTFDSGVERPERLYDPWPELSPKVSITAYGEITVELTVDEEGCVRHTELSGGDLPKPLTRDIMATFESWVFRPPRLDGEPVSARFYLQFGRYPRWKVPEGARTKPELRP